MCTLTTGTLNVKPGEKNQQRPSIHSALWHPHKTWIDILLSFLLSLLLSLASLPAPSTAEGDEYDENKKKVDTDFAQKRRDVLKKMISAGLAQKNGGFRRWSKVVGCDIVEATLKIQRQADLFRTITEDDEAYPIIPNNAEITVHVSFPITLLPNSTKAPTETNQFGCLILDADAGQDILTKIAKDVPTILYFHGGGMTLGDPYAPEAVELLVAALENCTDKPKAILVSVQYSLAPEHPFPAAPLDAWSVVSNFLDQGFEALHVMGVSAGGNLALVSGLEAYRGHRQKANIKSIFAGCPMLGPACDSLSHYQNSTSSLIAPVPWLKWCYQVYLELPKTVAQDTTSACDGDVLGRNSNRKAWNESKWAQSSLRRLVEPSVDLPANLEDGPTFLITTNAGDPLHDDGVAMVVDLKAVGASVLHHAHSGSHWLGTYIDRAAYNKIAKEWANVLFVDHECEQSPSAQ